MAKRSSSSKKWLREHFNDTYVQQAKQQGYRSRAAYKLLAIQQKDKLFKPGQQVLDLGAAPGSWSQVVAECVGDHGQVIALDRLEMSSLAGVTIIQGDFTEADVYAQVKQLLQGRPLDWVLSDMAPNMSGTKAVDQPRAMYLCELARDCALEHLGPGGGFLCKVFQGAGFDSFLQSLREAFTQVTTRKPDASRARSTEVYLLARGLKA